MEKDRVIERVKENKDVGYKRCGIIWGFGL
jgi:hypothetical protein